MKHQYILTESGKSGNNYCRISAGNVLNPSSADTASQEALAVCARLACLVANDFNPDNDSRTMGRTLQLTSYDAQGQNLASSANSAHHRRNRPLNLAHLPPAKPTDPIE